MASSTSAAAATNGTNHTQDFPQPSAHSIALSPTATPGIHHFQHLTNPSALKASQLLNQNHTDHHVFFNNSGFHNHITHHLLSLFSVNGTPAQLQAGYDANQSYQRSQQPIKQDVVAELQKDRSKLVQYLAGESKKGTEKWYADLMEFWAVEVKTKGVREVLQEWVFKRDDVAEKVFGRLFAGFLHPLIHLGFGLEYHQPAILAEALAQTCVHDNWVYPYLSACESSSASNQSTTTTTTTKPRTLISLLHESRSTSKILNSVKWSDGNKLRDGALTRAFPEIVALASQWTVQPTETDLEQKTAEMIVANALITGGAAFHHENNVDNNPVKKDPRIDFFYMHSLNASIFFSSFIEDPHVSSLMTPAQKARLLQCKGWVDVGMYISRGCAVLNPQDIANYEPSSWSSSSNSNSKNLTGAEAWQDIFQRVAAYDGDDGHAVKLVRALANGERVSRKWEDQDWCVIKGDMWVRLGYLVVDSIDRSAERVDGGGSLWVRGAGFDRAWVDVPERKVGGGGGGGGKL